MYRPALILFMCIPLYFVARPQDSFRSQRLDSLTLKYAVVDTVWVSPTLVARPLDIACVTQPNKNDNSQIAHFDSITYRQYLKKDYKGLLKTGKTARSRNVDFYYLNYRTAIAYYELKNYAKAAEFYHKTLLENPADPVLLENLYYACLLSGQQVNANLTARRLPPQKQAEIGYTHLAINNISLSGGYAVSRNNDNIRNRFANLDSVNQYQDMYFGGVTLEFNLIDRIKLNAGYNFFNTKFERYVGNNRQTNENLEQHQLNLGLEFFLKRSLTFGFTGGFYSIEKNNKITIQPNGSGFGYGNNGRNRLIPPTRNVDYNISALAFFNKRFAHTQPEITIAYSDFAYNNQLQTKLQLTSYPFGNLNFYGITAVAFIFNNNSAKTKQTVFSQNIGTKLAPNLWLDAMFSYGNHLNYITEHSLVVYDTFDPIKLIAGASLSCYFKKIILVGSYKWMQKEGWAAVDSYQRYPTYNYNNHLVNLLLQWNF